MATPCGLERDGSLRMFASSCRLATVIKARAFRRTTRNPCSRYGYHARVRAIVPCGRPLSPKAECDYEHLGRVFLTWILRLRSDGTAKERPAPGINKLEHHGARQNALPSAVVRQSLSLCGARPAPPGHEYCTERIAEPDLAFVGRGAAVPRAAPQHKMESSLIKTDLVQDARHGRRLTLIFGDHWRSEATLLPYLSAGDRLTICAADSLCHA